MEERDEKVRVKMFLYIIGSKGREIFETLHFEKARDERTLQDVMNAFEEHCNPKKNETVERYKFFTRFQEEGESIEKFVTDFKLLAATCNSGTLHDSLIRGRIICEIRNSTLREELLKVVNLDLDKCLRACRVSELSKERNKAIEATESINAVQKPKHESKPKKKRKIKCTYCGTKHERRKYPAYGKECTICDKLNHHASVCKTKQTGSTSHLKYVDDNDEDLSDYDDILKVDLEPALEVNSIVANKFPKRLYATIDVGKKPVRFQLDGGASCNVISEETLKNCLGPVKLEQTKRVLSMYNQTTLKPFGRCTLELHNRKSDKSYCTKFVVLKEQSTPLLGSETIQQMDLIQVRFKNILSLVASPHKETLTKEKIADQFPDVFQGTGKLSEPYHLQIDPSAKPVVHPPRKVPLALKTALKEELDRLECLQILTPVSEPTPWMSSMVIVKKPNGNIRVCLDPKNLNKVLKRSHYPMPTIDDILPVLSRAKVFSEFDVKMGSGTLS